MGSVIAFLGAFLLAAGLSLRGGDRSLLNGLKKRGFTWEPAIALATLTGALTGGAAAWLGATLASLTPAAPWWIGLGAAALALGRAASPPRRLVLREPTRRSSPSRWS